MWPGKKAPLGPYSVPSQLRPWNWLTSRGIWPRAGSIWPHYSSSDSSLQRADETLGHFWPGILSSLWPQIDPFPGHVDPGVFRAYEDGGGGLYTQGTHCIKHFRRKTLVILIRVLSYGKVNGKIMLTGVFRFYLSFFSGKSCMQWAPGMNLKSLMR